MTKPNHAPSELQKKLVRELYRAVHGHRTRHNIHFWPYVKISRNSSGYICRVRIFGNIIETVPLGSLIGEMGHSFHMILSGGSINDIDYSQLPDLNYVAVNGAVKLQDRANIKLTAHCVVDRSFAWRQRHLMTRIVSQPLVFFLTLDVLRYLLEYIPLSEVQCRFCVIEDVSEPIYGRAPNTKQVRSLQQEGHDLELFSTNPLLGFSYDPVLGWFDADTVAYSFLQVLVWCGAQQVFFHGLDIKGAEKTLRFYESDAVHRRSTRLERNFQRYIRPAFSGAVPSLARRGISIYNLSPISALGPDIIPFVDWKGLR